MTQANPVGCKARRYTAVSLLPWLLAAGCGAKPTAPAVPPSQAPQVQQPYVQSPPTTLVAPVSQQPATPAAPVAASGSDMVTMDQRYTPFAAGKSWTYKVHSASQGKVDDGTVTWTVEEAAADKTSVTVASTLNGQSHTVTNKVLKNADGSVTITSITDGQSQTQTVKPEDAQAQSQVPGAGQAAAMQGTKDTVTVAAGKFDAIKIVNTLSEGKGQLVAWYAPDIGLVKQEVQATTDQGPVASTMELTSYK